jgi:hypothetical protein
LFIHPLAIASGQNPVLEYLRRFWSGAYDPWVILIELLLIGSVVFVTLRFLQGTRGARPTFAWATTRTIERVTRST